MPNPNSDTHKNPIKKIAGCGCGAAILFAIAILALANYLGISARQPVEKIPIEALPTPKSPPVKLTFPKTYLGKWQAKDGTSITIRDDGKADFHSEDTDITGGILVIDEKKKLLKISTVFDTAEQWKIDRAPQTRNGKALMILNKVEFHRAP